MSDQVIYEKYNAPSTKRKSEVPVKLFWKNTEMIRAHSISATVKEILALSVSLDVVKVNIIGTPSTGKSTLAHTIAHLCHKRATIPYTIKRFNRDDLQKFEETLATLQPTNHILIFDDVSFLSATASKRQIDKIQKGFSEIRHLPGGQDVKIIAIFNFHYNMGMPKYLRQSDIFYYTSIGSSELENTQKLVGFKNTQKILDFRRVFQEAVTSQEFNFKIPCKHKYKYRDPFAPALYWNNSSLRIVVFPKREWIDLVCGECANSSIQRIQDNMDMKKFDSELREHFPEDVIREALKLKLYNLGVNTFRRPTKRCLAYVERYMENRSFNAEQAAEFYGLKQKPVRLNIPLKN